MRYPLRGLTESEANAVFTGQRQDPFVSGGVVNPLDAGRGRRILKSRASKTKLGLTISFGNVLVYTEGPLADLLPGAKGLSPVECLVDGARAARDFAQAFGVDAARCDMTLGRCDLAVDVGFASPAEGQRFLRGVAGLTLPRLKSNARRALGTPALETVFFSRRSGGIVLRVYDRSRRLGDEPGSVIRIEREWRPKGRQQPPTHALPQTGDLGRLFARPFEKYAADNFVVADPLAGCQLIEEQVSETLVPRGDGSCEVLTQRVAENLIGAAVRYAKHGERAWSNPRARRRRLDQLAALGVAVDADLELAVPVGQVLHLAARQWGASP